jgi:hypothetical protein
MKTLQSKGVPLRALGYAIAYKYPAAADSLRSKTEVLDGLCNFYEYEEKECQVLFLPAYSPDFSPIEETFSMVKSFVRRSGARTREALEEAIGQALLTVTTQDAHVWFRHCDYLPPQEKQS